MTTGLTLSVRYHIFHQIAEVKNASPDCDVAVHVSPWLHAELILRLGFGAPKLEPYEPRLFGRDWLGARKWFWDPSLTGEDIRVEVIQ